MTRQEQLNEAWCKYMGKCSTEIMQALAFALRWCDAHPHWISVDDELPKNRESILFTDGGCVCSGRYYGCRYYGDKGDWVDFCEVSTLIEDVTHWMPLPTPPVVSKMESTKQKGGEQ